MPALDEGTPLFVQIAEQLADDIVADVLAEGLRAPSTNELAAFYRINPATAAKGIILLVDGAVLEKRRGIGMFVAVGAREQLRARRHEQFAEQYLDPMLAEAGRLGIDTDALVSLIREIRLAKRRQDIMTRRSRHVHRLETPHNATCARV